MPNYEQILEGYDGIHTDVSPYSSQEQLEEDISESLSDDGPVLLTYGKYSPLGSEVSARQAVISAWNDNRKNLGDYIQDFLYGVSGLGQVFSASAIDVFLDREAGFAVLEPYSSSSFPSTSLVWKSLIMIMSSMLWTIL